MRQKKLAGFKTLIFLVMLVIVFRDAIHARQSIFKIDYIGQISGETDVEKEKSFFSTVSDYLFGKATRSLQKPISILADNSNLWVTDQDNNFIMSINKIKESFNDIRSEDDLLQSLVGVCQVGQDSVLISDSKLNKLFWFKKNDPEIQSFNTEKELNMPTGIACNPLTGHIWVVETGAHRISILNTSGKMIKTIGRRGSADSRFNFPGFIWIDRKGIACVVDALNFRVQIFDANGSFISKFGEAGDASGYLARPKGIATDSYGNIYVVDALFSTVQVFDRDGNYLYNFGKKGSGEEEFMLPMGIFIDESDQIYVADSYNRRVQIFKISRDSAFENSDKN